MVAPFRAGVVGAFFVINDGLTEELSRDADYILAMEKVTEEGAEYAQNIVPVGETGDLRASIHAEKPSIEDGELVGRIKVGEGAPYWAYVEYGTGSAGAGSEQPPPGLADGYSHGPSAGMAAQPYMRPTLWWLRQRIGF